MSKDLVIDADGHIIEDKEKLRSYLEAPFNRRGGSLVSAEPWDGHLHGTLPRNKEWSPHRPSANDWLRIMDKNNMEFAYLYSTSAGDVSGSAKRTMPSLFAEPTTTTFMTISPKCRRA